MSLAFLTASFYAAACRYGPYDAAASANDPDISYFYASRVPGEAADGVEDRHIHPVEPKQVRSTVKLAL